MSKTLAQIFALNPTATIGNNDLFYLVQSPYTPGTDAAILGSSLKTIFGSGTVNPGLINQLAYYAASGSAVSGLATANNGVLITSAGGVPSILAAGLTGQVLTATTGAPASWEYVPQITQFIVNPTPGLGNFTTIQAAITAASAGTDIYVTPGTYTENLTLKAGVNITTIRGNGSDGLVTILGNATFNAAGAVNLCNMQLKTNGAPFLTVSGVAASEVSLIGCTLNCSNNTGISYTTANAASSLSIVRCSGDIGALGTSLYVMSSTGTLTARYCVFSNSGGSVLQSTNSAGSAAINYCIFSSPISSSGTGSFLINYSFIDTSAQNATSLEMAGSGSSIIRYTDTKSGTATSISIDIGSTVNIIDSVVNSTNASAISGGGILNYALTSFINTSSITVATQNPVPLITLQGGTGLTSYILGDTLYASAANTLSKLAGNTTAVKQYLSQTGTGAVSAAPAWATIAGGDITGSALTKTDDTNVTLTLGGTPSTALLRAASITAGWTGQLALTRGGTAASLTADNGGIVYSNASTLAILAGTATARQMLQSGASTTPAWSTTTWPATTTINRLLWSSAANIISDLATANSSVLVTDSGGIPSLSTTLPSFTTNTITFNPTTAGIKGTTTNDSTVAGNVGEIISSIRAAGSALNVATLTNVDIASITLTAGDWDVWGNLNLITIATTPNAIFGWVSSTSATTPDASLYSGISSTATLGAGSGICVPSQRFLLSGSTIIYLTARTQQVSGNNGVCGGIYARRRR